MNSSYTIYFEDSLKLISHINKVLGSQKNYVHPWNIYWMEESMASGFIIEFMPQSNDGEHSYGFQIVCTYDSTKEGNFTIIRAEILDALNDNNTLFECTKPSDDALIKFHDKWQNMQLNIPNSIRVHFLSSWN